MNTGGLPQRLFALDQIAPLDRRAQSTEPSPKILNVTGAGNYNVNGKYVIQKKKHKDANKWYCAENNLTIFRCSMAKSGEYHWFISQAGE